MSEFIIVELALALMFIVGTLIVWSGVKTYRRDRAADWRVRGAEQSAERSFVRISDANFVLAGAGLVMVAVTLLMSYAVQYF